MKTKKRITNKKAKTEKKNKQRFSKILLNKLTTLSRKKRQVQSCNQDKHPPFPTYLVNNSIEFDKYYLKKGDKIPLFEKISWVISADLYPNTNKKIGGNIYSDEYNLYPTPFFERLRNLKNKLSNDQIKEIINKYDLSLFNIEHKKQNQIFVNSMFQDTEQKLAGILEGLTNNHIESSKNYKIKVID